MNKKVVNTVDVDGNELELFVLKPTAKQNSEASIIYSREWLRAESSGCPLRANLEKVAEKHGLWNDETKAKLSEVEKKMLELERKLRAGSKFFKTLEEGRKVALEIRKLRNERLLVLSGRSALDEHTAEAHAEKARLNYLISVTTVYNNGRQYFIDVDDYLERAAEKASQDISVAFMELMYSEILGLEAKYYENIFLLKHGFVDNKFRLIDKEGNLIDENGRKLDENGRYINSNNEYIDSEGNKVDKDGNYIIDYEPFPEENEELNESKEMPKV